jgi:hypothetical protein
MAAEQGQSLTTEERVQLAVEGYEQGHFKSIRQAAAVYNVVHSTVLRRRRGLPIRHDAQINNRKLSLAQEQALVQWILSMDERGMAPTIDYTRRMADLLLASQNLPASQTGPASVPAVVGECWVRRFVARHDSIKSQYSRRYDYRRAQCEDPTVIQQWF